jgi:PTH1 family peptidyl-tRNA hydrolase
MITHLIIGLGNPGIRYRNTRHNIGFKAVDALATAHQIPFSQKHSRALVATGRISGLEVAIAKPQTYMNLSGDSVVALLARHRVRLPMMLVVYDDMDLPIGKVRLRGSGSAAGHNGLQSIIDKLGTNDFPRLRIGIGRPQEESDASAAPDPVDHVLGVFLPGEIEPVETAVTRAVSAIECFLTDGLTTAMNTFNG